MKTNNNNNIYIDIGYTNIKISNNDNDNVIIEPIKKTIKLIKTLSKNNKCIISCNNLNYFKKISKFKNVYLISKEHFINDIKIDDNFKFNDLGIDLILYCYWLKINEISDAIIVSSGTCLVLIIVKDNILKSVQISSGYNLEINSIKSILKDINTNFLEEFDYFNTEKAINISYINKIKGLIEINKQSFNIDKNVYLTGNYFKNFVINKADNIFQDTKIIDNLCLEAIKNKF